MKLKYKTSESQNDEGERLERFFWNFTKGQINANSNEQHGAPAHASRCKF